VGKSLRKGKLNLSETNLWLAMLAGHLFFRTLDLLHPAIKENFENF
jgi:hypothetical protein